MTVDCLAPATCHVPKERISRNRPSKFSSNRLLSDRNFNMHSTTRDSKSMRRHSVVESTTGQRMFEILVSAKSLPGRPVSRIVRISLLLLDTSSFPLFYATFFHACFLQDLVVPGVGADDKILHPPPRRASWNVYLYGI